jgi:hypothetical protein
MNDATTPDFFDRLEVELRRAAERRPRRLPGGVRTVAAAGLALAALALAAIPLAAVLGGGAEQSRDVARPVDQPRPGEIIERHGERHRVVATGRAPVVGPWSLETYRSTRLADPETGELYQPAGLRCLGIYLRDGSGGGQCGEFPRTPGFSRVQLTVPDSGDAVRRVLLYGRAPEQATAVIVRLRDGRSQRLEPIEGPRGARGDFYVALLPPGAEGRVNWLDGGGRPGSRGIELLPS